MRTRIILSILALCLLAACGGGGGGQPTPPANSYTLTGSVMNAAGSAISGAQVLLGQSATTTSTSGSFSFTSLPAGYYIASVQDNAGNFTCRQLQLNASSTSFVFTLPASPVGFEVVSISPRLNSTGDALSSNIELEFSQPLNASALTNVEGWFNPDIGAITVDYEAGSTMLALDPVLQLPLNQQISIEIPTSLTSATGSTLPHVVRSRFRTNATDTAAPQLVESTPETGVSNHPPNLGVVFEFNEALDADTTVQASSVPPTTLSAVINGRYLYVQPAAGWQKSIVYALTVLNIADLLGNQYPQPLELTFTTSDQEAAANDIEPVWNPVDSSVVFASDRYGEYDIFQVNPNGTGLVRLTSMPGDERHPAISNDGQRLAFQYRSPGGKWHIYTQSLNGTDEPIQLTAGDYNDQQPTFSNTISNQLAFVSNREAVSDLYLMNSDGSNLHEADNDFGSNQYDPSFHPLLDTQLLFTSSRAGNRDVWRKTISAIDGTTINLNLTADFLSDETSPVFGPDASYFLFVSDYSGNNELWLAEADGSFPRQVTYFANDLADPAINPVIGSTECLVSLRLPSGNYGLAIVDIVSGELTQWLTGGGAND